MAFPTVIVKHLNLYLYLRVKISKPTPTNVHNCLFYSFQKVGEDFQSRSKHFRGPIYTLEPYQDTWYNFIGYQGMSRYYRYRFCFPTLCPTAPKSPTIRTNIMKPTCFLILTYFVDLEGAWRGCRAHCRDTKTVPVVHRHAMVFYIGVQNIIVRQTWI